MIINLSPPMIDHLSVCVHVCVCVCVWTLVHKSICCTSTAHPHRALHYPLAQHVCQRCRCHIKVMCLIINSTKGLPSSHLRETLCVQQRGQLAVQPRGDFSPRAGVCFCVCVCVHVGMIVFACVLEEE